MIALQVPHPHNAQDHSEDRLSSWQLERVNERFHVVALGLPVPRYRGNTLDPPFRSRFQSRHIRSYDFGEMVAAVTPLANNIDRDR